MQLEVVLGQLGLVHVVSEGVEELLLSVVVHKDDFRQQLGACSLENSVHRAALYRAAFSAYVRCLQTRGITSISADSLRKQMTTAVLGSSSGYGRLLHFGGRGSGMSRA